MGTASEGALNALAAIQVASVPAYPGPGLGYRRSTWPDTRDDFEKGQQAFGRVDSADRRCLTRQELGAGVGESEYVVGIRREESVGPDVGARSSQVARIGFASAIW